MLTCYFTRKRLGAYLDGALDPRATRSTAAHVTGCAGCQAEVDSLRRLRSLLQRTLVTAEPDWTGFWPGIVRGVRDSKVPAPAPRRAAAWRPRWALGSALAAALLVSLGVWQLTPGTHPTPAGVVISSATTGDPAATVVAYATPEQDIAVVWVLGLKD